MLLRALRRHNILLFISLTFAQFSAPQGPWYHVEPRMVTCLNNSEHHKGKWDVGAGEFYTGRKPSGEQT